MQIIGPHQVTRQVARLPHVNQRDAKFSASLVQSIMLRQRNPLYWRSWLSMRVQIMRGLFGTAFLLISTACFAADYIPPGDTGETPPGYGGPVYGGPGYGEPAYGAPVYGGPVYGGPAYGAPVYGGPVYGGPVYRGPIYSGPAYGAPVYRGPVYGGPVYGVMPPY
jgi:hypothetical protein